MLGGHQVTLNLLLFSFLSLIVDSCDVYKAERDFYDLYYELLVCE